MTTTSAWRLALMLAVGIVACGGDTLYEPVIPDGWAPAVTNSMFPLTPGTTWEFEEGSETITVEVLATTKAIMGVTATEVRDRVFVSGELVEDTYDWYAQDDAGNVWYLGEDTKEYEDGVVVSTAGTWQWGVNGGLPGIIMWADPAAHMNEEYRQEYLEGEAEDWGKVVATNESVTVAFGSFTGCLRVEEWSALESAPHQDKYYCSGIGHVLEVAGGGGRVELVDKTTP